MKKIVLSILMMATPAFGADFKLVKSKECVKAGEEPSLSVQIESDNLEVVIESDMSRSQFLTALKSGEVSLDWTVFKPTEFNVGECKGNDGVRSPFNHLSATGEIPLAVTDVGTSLSIMTLDLQRGYTAEQVEVAYPMENFMQVKIKNFPVKMADGYRMTSFIQNEFKVRCPLFRPFGECTLPKKWMTNDTTIQGPEGLLELD